MSGLAESLDRVAFDARFSGVVRVDRGNAIEFAAAYGFADRRHRIPNRMDTQFGIASGVKGLTALTVMTLVQEGRLELATTARSMLGRDLPLIDDSVTVEHPSLRRWCVGTATRRATRVHTVSGSGCTSRASWWSCTDTTPAHPSRACTIRPGD